MLGLYLHIPYCAALCHYCDFAKTANYGPEHAARYLARLAEHLDAWLGVVGEGARFGTVFFGGGTPSLFAAEYAPLMAKIRARLEPGAEVSLEANPDDVTPERLAVWRELGVTRLSLGVQTFQSEGLRFLKRAHDGARARRAIADARAVFPNANADLIYGWPGQTPESWRADLQEALALGVGHLSLYNLTFEARTPIGRAALRGALTPADEERLERYYRDACEVLADAGLRHEEVSNWARPGASCRHNWLYWSDQPFVGIGAGAHGYLRPDADGPGVRYAYDRRDRPFLKHEVAPAVALSDRFGVIVERDRSLEAWLTEYVGSSLRTERGTDLALCARRTGIDFRPTRILREGLDTGMLTITNERLILPPAEWFRETAWAVEVLLSFEDRAKKSRLTGRNGSDNCPTSFS